MREPLKNLEPHLDETAFYRELTSRNHHFISPDIQAKLKNFKILIAGCGSTGGACIEALARVGVTQFVLTDNGTYDVSNLNRQHARLDAIGKNKASFHREEVLAINPYANCRVESEGVLPGNVKVLCQGVDLVFDAVDVTTSSGIMAKIALHEEAKRLKLPVFSALDLGFKQWGKSFDYRKSSFPVLGGKRELASRAEHPIKALFEIYPLSAVPDHCLDLFSDLLDGKSEFASQLGCTSDLLSSIIVPAVIRFLDTSDLVAGWSIDLHQISCAQRPNLFRKFDYWKKRHTIKQKLKSIR